MLLLDHSEEIAGLTIFHDHLSAGTFHYLPGPPEVVRTPDGELSLALLRYRGENQGAILVLETELARPASALEAARQELEQRVGAPVNLAQALFEEGSVRLTGLGVAAPAATGEEPASAPRLVERALGSTVPSLVGANRASFLLELTAEGAALVAAALEAEELPLLILYDLTFSGLQQARGVRARVDFRMAYEYLRSRFALNALIFRADLDREAESLEREGLIQIEDVDYLGEDPEKLAERRQQIVATLRELTETLFFAPSASPSSLGAEALGRSAGIRSAWAAAGQTQAAFLLRSLEQVEERELTYDLSVTQVARRRIAPQGALRLPQDADVSRLIRDVDLDWPPPEVTVRVAAAPGADWAGVEALQFDIRSGDELRSAALTPSEPDKSVTLPAGLLEYRFKASVKPDAEALGEPGGAQSDFQPLPAATLLFDPAALAGRRLLRISLGAVDFEQTASVEGRLSAGESARAFLLDRDQPELEVAAWGGEPLRLTATLHMVDGQTLEVDESIPPAATAALINQPAALYRLVAVELADPLGRFESAFVELEGMDGRTRRMLRLSQAQPSGRWSLLRGAGADGYRYRVRLVGKDAAVVEGDWAESVDSLLLVGDAELRVERIQILLLGAADSQGALLKLTSLEPPENAPAVEEAFLQAGQTAVEVRLAFRRDAPRRYQVEGQVFLPDRVAEVEPREETAEVLLIAIEGTGG